MIEVKMQFALSLYPKSDEPEGNDGPLTEVVDIKKVNLSHQLCIRI